MRQMSQPRKPRKGEDKTALHFIFDAEKLARLIPYNAQDVRTSRAIWRHPKVKPLIASERQYPDPRRNHQLSRCAGRSRAGHRGARHGGS